MATRFNSYSGEIFATTSICRMDDYNISKVFKLITVNLVCLIVENDCPRDKNER